MTDWKSKILQAIDDEQDQLLELCSQLIRFPSENPPGDSRDISAFIISYLKEAGIDTSIHPATDTMLNLVSTLSSGADEPSGKISFSAATPTLFLPVTAPAGSLIRSAAILLTVICSAEALPI